VRQPSTTEEQHDSKNASDQAAIHGSRSRRHDRWSGPAGTGGTGKYKGLSGDNTFVGVTQVNWADGTSSGYSTWNR
jgi:hypothetical protein